MSDLEKKIRKPRAATTEATPKTRKPRTTTTEEAAPKTRKPRAVKAATPAVSTETLLPCAWIAPNFSSNNDREEFDPVKLQELADSIKANGLAQPIIVRPASHPTDAAIKYEVVAGERRFRAVSRILRWESIPAIVREMSEEQASAIMLVENTGRADLLPTEEALGYQKRIDRYGWDIARIAEVAGKSVDIVKSRLKLLNLDREFWPMVNSGLLPVRHAELASTLPVEKQRAAMRVFGKSTGMNYAQFSTVVHSMADAGQESLFALEEYFEKQMDKAVLSSPADLTSIISTHSLPEVQAPATMSTAEVIFQYILDLQNAGHSSEAAAVGILYQKLTTSNFVKPIRKITL